MKDISITDQIFSQIQLGKINYHNKIPLAEELLARFKMRILRKIVKITCGECVSPTL